MRSRYRSHGRCRADVDGRQESQLGSLQHGFVHLYVERSIQQVDILLKSLLNQCLQLWIGEHLTPRQVAERGGILYHQRVGIVVDIANQSLGIHVGTLVLIIYTATAQEQRSGCKYHYLLHSQSVYFSNS